MYRVNEEQNELMTLSWLKELVVEMREVNEVWPYLTVLGFVNENDKNLKAASQEELVNYMASKNYTFVCVAQSNENGYKEIIFKFTK